MSLCIPIIFIIQFVLKKIEMENTKGVIDAPFFTTQTWCTRLIRVLVQIPLPLPGTNNAWYFPYREKANPKFPKVKLLACQVSGNFTRIREYQTKLQEDVLVHS